MGMLLRARAPTFISDRRAASAIEFAIWAPFMCFLFLGSVDIIRYVAATGRLSDVAGTMAQMLSVNTTGTVNYLDLQFYHDSAMITFPQVLTDAAQQNKLWSNDMAITMTSITFTATPSGCTSSCSYVPKVVWTTGTNKRPCTPSNATTAPITSASDTSSPSASTLPADSFGPTSLLVVDIAYTFRPLFAVRPLPGLPALSNINIARSFYTSPRYVQSVGYQSTSGDPGSTTLCP